MEDLLRVCGDYIAEVLDEIKGKDIKDQSIFRAHAAKYEVQISLSHFLTLFRTSFWKT